jgi:hypothetical protein
MNPPARPSQSVLVGMLRVARGRADGIACFGATSQSFLASLAPLLAFPLVGATLGIFTEGPWRALASLAMTLCALLTPPVLSYEIAKLWNRADAWARFATAFNWCEWVLPAIACLVMVPLSVAITAGLSEKLASYILIACLSCYGLWLHWFLARNALSLSIGRAIAMVILVNAGTVAVVVGPGLLVSQLQ